jgi:anaerobic selenocysteine-containing dehydrogenase
VDQKLGIRKSILEQPQKDVITSMCGVCPSGCGANIHLKDGKIERVLPIRGHPYSVICPRGMRAKEIVYSPDRLLYPQKRANGRGGDQFQRITWDEAYESIVGKMGAIKARYGPEAMAIYTGRGNFEFGLNEMFAPSGTVESSANAVLFPFGSPNATGVGSLCYASYGMIASYATFGDFLRNVKEDIDHADLILIWGENPATDSPPINLRRVKNSQRHGARVVVVDHRRSETAIATHAEWIGVRPGTDGALALSLMQVLIELDLYDREFVENWTHGFDELSEYVQEFTPEKAEYITGVPAERIRELARAIGEARGCSLMTYTGLEYSNSGVQAIRAVWILQALAGHLDAPGGKLFKMRGRIKLNRLLTDPPVDARPPVGSEQFPLYYEMRREAHAAALPRAILEGKPYPIRGLIISGASILTSWPDPDLWREAFQALDFLAVVNRFPTEDGKYADLILPATTMFEIESYIIHDSYVQLRQKVIDPPGEARNDYLIFAELARRLGYGDHWPQTEEEMVAYALEDSGVSVEALRNSPDGIQYIEPEMHYRKYASGELRQDRQPGFQTPSGKFEIASEWFRQHGYSALPVYEEPVEGPLGSPELYRQYPLVFNSGARTQSGFRSQHHNIPSLVEKHPWPLVNIHTQDARARGIKEGDQVFVISPRGEVPFHAHVTDDIVPGVVEVNMGGGGPIGPMEWQIANVNELTDFDNREEISGFPVYKALLCEVRKKESI